MAKRIRVGDVIEIRTEKGLAYAQVSHIHPQWGSLIRVLPGLYSERPADFSCIVTQPSEFVVFFPAKEAVQQDIVRIVSSEVVPDSERHFPTFRSGTIDPRSGRVEIWWLWDGEKSWRIDSLTDEQRDLPIREVINDTLLIERIEQGWRPRVEQ